MNAPQPAAAAPTGLLFLPQDTSVGQLDAELHTLAQAFEQRAKAARIRAKRHRSAGDLIRWRQANAVAQAWEQARAELWGLGIPF